MRNKNREAINEMRLMLGENKSLRLENFVMPHMENEEGSFEEGGDEERFNEEPPVNSNSDVDNAVDDKSEDISGIEKELTQIRKIALSVINRLADRPTCPQYDTMKKIWNMVDKAIEQPQNGSKSVE